MPISEAFVDSASIGTTEYSLTNDSTTLAAQAADGVYQLFLDLSALVAGDEYELKVYEKVSSAGTQRLVESFRFAGVQGSPHTVLPSLILMHGWDFTLQKIAGTDRSIGWSIRKVA
jgi:hypothetical protein